jgi:hypothetical protein
MDTNPAEPISPADSIQLRSLHAAVLRWESNLDGHLRFPTSTTMGAIVEADELKVRACWAGLSETFRSAHPDLVSKWATFGPNDVGSFTNAVADLVSRLPDP